MRQPVLYVLLPLSLIGCQTHGGLEYNPDEAGCEGASFYADVDGDGYGSAASSTDACSAPEGFVDNDSDCDDTDPQASPLGIEVCDGIDNDCDASVDEPGAYGESAFFLDGDGDGFAGPIMQLACEAPAGAQLTSTDCDDGDAAVNPDATEVCDSAGVDENCDGVANDDDATVTERFTYYVDEDSDGFGTGVTVEACTQPANTATVSGDCADDAASVNPAAEEICNGGDDDCDDATTEVHCNRTVFVTSVAYNGHLGGLSGADSKCQNLADAAGLDGTYMAWLSSDKGSPASRFTRSTSPYVLFDGTRIADDWDDLVDGSLGAAIDVTEQGTLPTRTNWCGWNEAPAWSHTAPDGTFSGGPPSCDGWRSSVGPARWGSASDTDGKWSAFCNGGQCAWTAPLYCFQQ